MGEENFKSLYKKRINNIIKDTIRTKNHKRVELYNLIKTDNFINTPAFPYTLQYGSDISKIPILRPLSGMNKNEIINRAKEIGTYETSILPYEDCCSFFVPAHPETKAKMNDIKSINKKLNLTNLINKAISSCEIINYKFLENA